MPVRLLTDRVIQWPDAETVRAAAIEWAGSIAAKHDEVRTIGIFGSYARDNWGVGSDLDAIIIVDETDAPYERRALTFDMPILPVPVDLLVYTASEWDRLERGGMRRAAEEMVWLYRRDGIDGCRPVPQPTDSSG